MPQYPASFNVSNLDGNNGFAISGAAANDRSGTAVATAGDFNGDGYADLLIGAYTANAGGVTASGEAFLLYGKAAGFTSSLSLTSLDPADGFEVLGSDALEATGYSVASAGDLDGDGTDDLLIGTFANTAYVVFGLGQKADSGIDLAAIDGDVGFKLNGFGKGAFGGSSVASAGDINGDGIDDVIFGAPEDDPAGATNGGKSYVLFGKSGSFGTPLDVSLLDGTSGFVIEGAAANKSGSSVAGGGDVNGDGIDDLVIGGPAAGGGTGVAHVVFGNSSGFAATLGLANLAATSGFSIVAPAGGEAGRSVAIAGDINGDGVDDIIVGAPGVDAVGATNAGAAYVIFGSKTGFTSPVDLSTLNGTNGFRISGVDEFGSLGSAVSGAGDINGDGFADLLVGAPGRASGTAAAAGSVYVVLGKAGGFASDISVTTLTGDTGFRIDGKAANNFLGHSVATAGDVNKDGFSDIILGADGASPNSELSNAGESYVIFGKRADASMTVTGTSAGLKHNGGRGNDDIDAGGGNDSVLGWEGDDDLKGGSGNDAVDGGTGNDRIDGGAGDDQLKGGTGNDVIVVSAGVDVIDGGDGVDLLSFYGHGTDGVTVDLKLATFALTSTDVQNLASIENVYGSEGDDVLTGNAGNNKLSGSWGDDEIHGGDGNDSLRGGAGADLLDGGAGRDGASYFFNGPVHASLDGSLGSNTGSAAGDTYLSIENLSGSDGFGDGLSGDANNNSIYGNGGDDWLFGRAGDDWLRGGLGKDVLSGGFGRDKYYFAGIEEAGDRITNFSGADTIVVKAAGFGGISPGIPGSQSFSSGTGNLATNVAHRFIYRTTDDTLWFDRDGTGTAYQTVMICDLDVDYNLTQFDIVII